MLKSILNINYIRMSWKGPRHERMYRIWAAVAKYLEPRGVRCRPFPNCKMWLGHDEAMEIIWRQEQQRPEQYALLIDHDVLLDLEIQPIAPFAPIEMPTYSYGVGNLKIFRLIPGLPMPWYFLVDKERFNKPLDWKRGGPFHDPGGGFKEQLSLDEYRLEDVKPGLPEFPGVVSFLGKHLFWSRHWHDPPGTVLGDDKIRVRDIQSMVDRTTDKWLEEQSDEFKEIYEESSGG
jgi:hypothetical protein